MIILGCITKYKPEDIRPYVESIEQTEFNGKKIKSIVDGGNLVPDDVVSEVVKNHINTNNLKDNIIFDGYPRSVGQAKHLDKMLEEVGSKLDMVVYLEIPKEEVIKRLSSRLVCTNCGATYNKNELKGKDLTNCKRCGHKIIQRKDDTPSAISIRFENYKKSTLPLINYYKEKNILKEIPYAEHTTVKDLVKYLSKLGIF